MMRGWPHPHHSSAGAKATFVIPLQWTRLKLTTAHLPTRYSKVGSAMAIASASAFVTTATMIGVGKSLPATSSSKCEADSGKVGKISVSPWYQEPMANSTTIPEDSLLRTTLVAIESTALHDNIEHPSITQPKLSTPTTMRRWWRFQWWHTDDGRGNTHHHNTLWWKHIGQSFFVITRGIEIVIRLSPLIILTPTAMLVSYTDTLWRRTWKRIRRNHHNGLTSPLVLQMGDLAAHDDIYTTQFQEDTNASPASSLQHHNYQTSTWASDLAWSYTLYTLQCLGPAFVKLGQWAATRRDLFPVHVCNRFAELHDTARVHEWKYTHQSLVDSFGSDYEERGLIVRNNNSNANSNILEEEGKLGGGNNIGILGSGCAAQVHIGTLHNKTVAVKVLHPRTRQSIHRDLALMQHIADFIDSCLPLNVVKMLSLPRAVSNFATVMTGQVDLRIEGSNLRAFRDNFGCSKYHDNDGDDTHSATRPYQTITFPYPETEWVSEHVLVEEYAGEDAFPISRYLLDNSSDGLKTRKELAGILLRAFLKMVFIDNFIHADLHPGNVLIRAIPNKSNPKLFKYNIIFIDAGIATSLQPNDRKNLHDLFKAIVLNDGYTAGQLMVERARYERCTSIPGGKHAFATGVADIVSEFHDRRKQGLTLGAVRVGALLGRVLDLCRRYQVEIDPAMSSVVVSMLVLEGLGRSLDPDLNLMKAAMPFLIGKV